MGKEIFIQIGDDFVKRDLYFLSSFRQKPKSRFPMKIGIQLWNGSRLSPGRRLDTGLHRCDDFFRDHHLNPIFHYSNIPTFQ